MKKRIQSAYKKALASFALLSVEVIIVLVLFILALIIFTIIVYRIFKLQSQQFDFYVFDQLNKLVSPGTTRFMELVTLLGNHKFLIPAYVLVIVYFLFIKRHRWYSIKVPVVAIGGVSLMFLLKQFFNRPRPLIPLLEPVSGLSFPSGHAMMSMSFYGLLIYLIWDSMNSRVWKWIITSLLLLIILLIGFSRIYLRVHYFSDVVAGFTAGIMWLTLSIWTVRRIERYRRRKIGPIIPENPVAKA